ncbi:MAG: A/G-specific adenine glycosylase, partial [Gemmataceae bacterium]|nr:A/G-specific adenine glycosylase [Gemmataceae bacterium]
TGHEGSRRLGFQSCRVVVGQVRSASTLMLALSRPAVAPNCLAVQSVRRRLLSWFDRHARKLPWRGSADPYAVWVSEVMLQQTQVATVIPYFRRFLQAFPTIQALAAANEQDVLRLWEGLGYYRRARSLHAAARQVCDLHGGVLPNQPDDLRRLPGLGRYTVNAILSQAFGRPVPIVEANSRRVLCRLAGLRGASRAAATEKRLWDLAATLVSRHRPGDFNQALMELGALVCTATSPRCHLCPLQSHCAARCLGIENDIPPRGPRLRLENTQEVALALRRADRVLLVQRPQQGRWGGLWELPRRAIAPNETVEAAACLLLEELGLRAVLQHEVATIRYGVTRFRVALTCLEARHRGGRFRSGLYRRGRWVRPAELVNFPLSRPQRRLADFLADAG